MVSFDIWIFLSVFYVGHYPCLSSVWKPVFFMLNLTHALFSSDKIFLKPPHKSNSLEDTDAEKIMWEILSEGENNHQVFSFLH